MDIKMANNPRHTRTGRQYWAKPEPEGELVGTMRFCPQAEDRPQYETLKKFERACVLPAECWPGSEPHGCNKWCMRWRGQRDGEVILLNDDRNSKVEFKKDGDGKLTCRGVFNNNWLPTQFVAEKMDDLPPTGPNDRTVTGTWDNWKEEYNAAQKAERF